MRLLVLVALLIGCGESRMTTPEIEKEISRLRCSNIKIYDHFKNTTYFRCIRNGCLNEGSHKSPDFEGEPSSIKIKCVYDLPKCKD